jgi:hypothetical protein
MATKRKADGMHKTKNIKLFRHSGKFSLRAAKENLSGIPFGFYSGT